MRVLLNSLILFFGVISPALPSHAVQSFQMEREQDLSMKHELPIYLQHRIGDVSVQGWVQDRIRVTLKMRVLAGSKEEADREFQKLDLIALDAGTRFEMRVGHARGVDLVSKMRDARQSAVQVDLEIKAPYQTDFSVILGEGRSLVVDQWRGGFLVDGSRDHLSFSRLTMSRELRVNCRACDTEIHDSKFKGRIAPGQKPLILSGVESDGVSIDAENDEIRIDRSTGDIGIHSRAGRLTVSRFSGKLRFQSEDGGAFLNQLQGAAEVQTQTGQVLMDWERDPESVEVDTEKGDIQIALPASFEGGLDLMSLRGEVIVQFPYEARKLDSGNAYGPPSPGRVDGKVGRKKGGLIHAFSKQGGVRILRKGAGR